MYKCGAGHELEIEIDGLGDAWVMKDETAGTGFLNDGYGNYLGNLSSGEVIEFIGLCRRCIGNDGRRCDLTAECILHKDFAPQGN